MALVPVDHRYVVENGRLIHYIALEDPATGRSVTNQVDEGAADPGTPEGPVDDTPNPTGMDSGTPGPVGGSDMGGLPPLTGVNYGMPGPGGQYSFGGTNMGANIGAISAGQGSSLGSAFMKPDNYNFGDISAGIGPRAGGSMGEYTDPRAAQLQMMGQAPSAPAAGAGLPGTPGAGATGAANADGSAGVAGNPGDDWRNFGNLARFNPENPQMAMVQKMLDMGMQPFNKLNPFMGMLQRAAAGLAASFMINQANNPANTMGVGSAPPDPSAMFSDFLGKALGGGSVLASAQSGLGGIKPALDTFRAQQAAGGGNASQVNPFLSALIDLMSSNQGEGATSMLSAMQTPLMPRGLAKGYDEGLNQSLAGANKNFWSQTPNAQGAPGTDFMKFLMGV